MDIHKNARLTPILREELARKVSVRTAAKWAVRYRSQGAAGLLDRSSRPHRLYRPTSPQLVLQVEQLRRLRWTGYRIAASTRLSPATVSRILKRLKLNRIRDLEPASPALRYEHEAPGDLLHLDIKKLGRIGCIGHRIHGDRKRNTRHVGWEYVHVAIDDHSRIAFSQVLPNEKALSAAAFLLAALRFYAQLGITIRRLLTDNGPCYRSHALRRLCQLHGIRHIYTKPYTPRTNGKAERFIQTALREWAYARAYSHSDQRTQHLPRWLHDYNWHRPHASLKGVPPISRSGLDRNNLLRQHS